MISGVIHGVIRPPVRATLSTGGGAPAGYKVLRYDAGAGSYKNLLYNDGSGTYRPLAYKVAP